MQDGPTFSIELSDPTSAEARPTRSFYERRRNRHGRGMRGALLPQHLPGSRSRSEQFDDWVMESAERLERLWGERIQDLQIMVQEIPDGLEDMTPEALRGMLGSCTPASPGRPAVITVYRHPVLMAARGVVPVNELVHDVVVEQTAELMGLAPEAVDPAYGRSQA
jgi:predicted Zn-dependent protease with MMP-like domain